MDFFDRNFARIVQAAGKVAAKPAWDVLMIANWNTFDPDEFRTYRSERISSIQFIGDLDTLRALDRRFDIAVITNSTAQEHVPLFTIRQKNLCDFVFVWTFDNHHAQART